MKEVQWNLSLSFNLRNGLVCKWGINRCQIICLWRFARLIFCQIINNGSLYGDLKRICETDLGLVSQCCFTKHVFRMSKQYFADIYMALKINAKLLVDALRFLEEWSRNYSYLSESNMGRNQNIIYSLQGWCEYSRRMSREWCSTVRLAGSNNNLYLSCENKQTIPCNITSYCHVSPSYITCHANGACEKYCL